MSIQGTVSCTLKVSRITVDFLQNPIKFHALVGLVNEATGATVAWTEGSGGVWSPETLVKLKELIESMEQDIGGRLFLDSVASSPALQPGRPGMEIGIGEHVAADDAPSI